MSGRLRFTAVLVVLLVIGLAGMASGNDGDPIIVGQTVTGGETTFTFTGENNTGWAFTVEALSASDTPESAIRGEGNTGGIGVEGSSDNNIGVLGNGGFGNWGVVGNGGPYYGGGVLGYGGGAVGVRADSGLDADSGLYGVGLQSIGQVQFSKASALAKVVSGLKSVTVHLKFDLLPGSMVLATSQSSGGSVRYVQKNPTADSFTIVLNSAATKDTLVAWFVISPYPLP